MIETYCCHCYGSETWDFSNSNFIRVLNSWNISIRKALNSPFMTHQYLLPVLAGHNPHDVVFSKFLSMYQSMSCSTNEHVKCISKMAKMDVRSVINNR